MKALTSLLVLLFLLPLSLPAQEEFEIVLRVNERIATTWDYYRRRTETIQRIQAADSLPAERRQRMLANVGVSTMDDIFEELLMLSRADQLGLKVTPGDLERALASTRQSFGITTDEQFEQALGASNMTLEEYKKSLERNILVQKLMSQEVHPRVSLEEEDLRRYYQNHSDDFTEPERVHLQEIVILSDSGLSRTEMEQTAEAIRQQVEAGQELATVVAPLVEQGVASSAVDLGWVEVGHLDAALEQAVWSLAAGGVSEPVEGRGGLHVLKVIERSDSRLLEFAEVEDQIRAVEGERLMGFEMQKYLEELEASAYIIVNPPPDAAGFRASLQIASDSDELEEALTAPLITQPGADMPVAPDDGIDPDAGPDDDVDPDGDPVD